MKCTISFTEELRYEATYEADTAEQARELFNNEMDTDKWILRDSEITWIDIKEGE